jgi:hypothetical protein
MKGYIAICVLDMFELGREGCNEACHFGKVQLGLSKSVAGPKIHHKIVVRPVMA